MANASTYLNKTFSTGDNRKKWTWSAWIKRSNLSSDNWLFNAWVDSSNENSIFFDTSDRFGFSIYEGATNNNGRLTTTRKFRDTSAWYHIQCVWDSANATATDRMIIYVNGERETAFDTQINATLNYDSLINSNNVHYIGQYGLGSPSMRFSGLITHMHFIDGTAYPASTFGETDANGVWIPKLTPSVTYGTNGFFLKFNEGALGTDSSPNGNNFTVNGSLTASKDTPDNVYATMNPLDNYIAGGTFANGNNTITTVNTGYTYNTSTMGVNKGKWYWECKWSAQPTGSANQVLVGIAKRTSPSTTTWLGVADYTYAYQGTGGVHNSNTILVTYTTWSIGDIIGVALDMDNNRLYFSRNGTWQGSSDPANGTNPISITAPDSTSGDSGFYFPAFGDGNNNLQETGQFNFGNGYFGTTAVASAGSNGNGSIFEFDCPSGYYALNTKNLATYG